MAGVFNRFELVALLQAERPDMLGWTLHLFVNDVTPTDVFTNANVTEATFAGSAAQNLNAWGVAYENGDGIAEIDEDVHVFTATGAGLPQTIYGYFIRDIDGLYIAGERAATPFVMNAAGLSYIVVPRVTLENGA